MNDQLILTGHFGNERLELLGYLESKFEIKGNVLSLDFDPLPGMIDDEFTLIYIKN